MRLQPRVVCEDRAHEFMNPSCPIVTKCDLGDRLGQYLRLRRGRQKGYMPNSFMSKFIHDAVDDIASFAFIMRWASHLTPFAAIGPQSFC